MADVEVELLKRGLVIKDRWEVSVVLWVAAMGAVYEPLRDGPSPKRLLNEYASSKLIEEIGVTPRVTAAQTARELLEFADLHLPVPQRQVLRLWLEGSSFDDIGEALGHDPNEALKLQRAAVAALRREFAEASDPGQAG